MSQPAVRQTSSSEGGDLENGPVEPDAGLPGHVETASATRPRRGSADAFRKLAARLSKPKDRKVGQTAPADARASTPVLPSSDSQQTDAEAVVVIAQRQPDDEPVLKAALEEEGALSETFANEQTPAPSSTSATTDLTPAEQAPQAASLLNPDDFALDTDEFSPDEPFGTFAAPLDGERRPDPQAAGQSAPIAEPVADPFASTGDGLQRDQGATTAPAGEPAPGFSAEDPQVPAQAQPKEESAFSVQSEPETEPSAVFPELILPEPTPDGVAEAHQQDSIPGGQPVQAQYALPETAPGDETQAASPSQTAMPGEFNPPQATGAFEHIEAAPTQELQIPAEPPVVAAPDATPPQELQVPAEPPVAAAPDTAPEPQPQVPEPQVPQPITHVAAAQPHPAIAPDIAMEFDLPGYFSAPGNEELLTGPAVHEATETAGPAGFEPQGGLMPDIADFTAAVPADIASMPAQTDHAADDRHAPAEPDRAEADEPAGSGTTAQEDPRSDEQDLPDLETDIGAATHHAPEPEAQPDAVCDEVAETAPPPEPQIETDPLDETATEPDSGFQQTEAAAEAETEPDSAPDDTQAQADLTSDSDADRPLEASSRPAQESTPEPEPEPDSEPVVEPANAQAPDTAQAGQQKPRQKARQTAYEFENTAKDAEAGDTARALLDIMSMPSDAAQPQERALAADTLLGLLTRVPDRQLIPVCERICLMETPPALLLQKLINHPNTEVAGILLEQCKSITDHDLIEIVEDGDNEKQRLIARRRDLSPALCDALVRNGDASVYLTIVRNPGASLSHDAFVQLSEQARSQPTLQAPLATRGDTPPPIAFELFWFLPSELRRYVLSRFLTDSATLDRILKIAKNVDKSVAEGSQQNTRAADKRKLEEFVDILADGRPEAIAYLAELAGISEECAQRITADPEGEPLTVIMKALGASRSAVSTALETWQKSPKAPLSQQRSVNELKALFDSLSFNKARVLLTYWDWSSQEAGPYARKAA